MSAGNLSDIEEEEEIEFCGPEDDPDDYDDILNSVEGNAILIEPGANFKYSMPEDEYADHPMKRYTLEEMEELFEKFNDVLIV
ncbi:unnamed protein product [Strongylus vulgaris]|uniref:Uncharacterized protein n=1 Tax=Strongylus vulgaris TaxID=40348 RepID=A0A3P7KKL0_STRVU|nr:unnamed protein product [Strongylus vulgaris]